MMIEKAPLLTITIKKLQFLEITTSQSLCLNVWMAQGMGQQENMLLNVASIPHEPNEADLKPVEGYLSLVITSLI